jgi:hypothetical protein
VYPVYGDASLRSFDARSGSKLYVRVDKDKSYALFGDFVTGDGFTPAGGAGQRRQPEAAQPGPVQPHRHRRAAAP